MTSSRLFSPLFSSLQRQPTTSYGCYDQYAVMEAAIREVLAWTRHMWCGWHVLKNTKENLAGVNNKTNGFKVDFNNLISTIMPPDAFEHQWYVLLE
ncbi:protein FAR1-RELATED SEQUENCE 5-like [Panicum miliaceum]|uniref:Protein FAR1-RELATED SEQUENCE n=1 Tax=Panicum miliaceum TaxID=4540 RepID=A0A3L6Q652_PANMI|nr:protein FAR1-RELATED SEQUENCE 5-like [Panicum miliaceum]